MKKLTSFLLLVAVTLFAVDGWAGWQQTRAGEYRCMEVEVFQTLGKGGKIDQDTLYRLQQKIVARIDEEKIVRSVRVAGRPSCPAGKNTMILGGTVLNYKKGNTGAAVMLPMAGDAKIVLHVYIKDKATGEILAEQKKLSRRDTGQIGGIDPPIEREIAIEVAKFVKKGE